MASYKDIWYLDERMCSTSAEMLLALLFKQKQLILTDDIHKRHKCFKSPIIETPVERSKTLLLLLLLYSFNALSVS